MAKVTLEKMFVFNGHTMNIEIDEDTNNPELYASPSESFSMAVVSVSSVPIYDEDEACLGTYPQNFAEAEASEFLNESYDPKSELDTLSVFIHETKQAVSRNFADGTFTRVN